MPKVFYVGDNITYKIVIEKTLKYNEKIELKTEALSLSWGTLKDIKLKKQELEKQNDKLNFIFTISMSIIPYETGILEIPKIDLGSFTIDNLNIFVKSILKEDDKISGIKKPILLPYSRLLMFSIVLLLIISFLMYFYFAKLFSKFNLHFKELHKRIFYKLSIKKRIKELFNYRKYKGKLKTYEFYYILTDVLRDYFQYFFNINNYSLSSKEFIDILVSSFSKNKEIDFKFLEYIIKKSNKVKFSDIIIDFKELEQDLKLLKIELEKFEKFEKHA